ncbi:hypothetical protein IG631_13669 [Alternaria alternata]|nr:hypothetical protein IG631_13669 [Alternaria alternata]
MSHIGRIRGPARPASPGQRLPITVHVVVIQTASPHVQTAPLRCHSLTVAQGRLVGWTWPASMLHPWIGLAIGEAHARLCPIARPWKAFPTRKPRRCDT